MARKPSLDPRNRITSVAFSGEEWKRLEEFRLTRYPSYSRSTFIRIVLMSVVSAMENKQ